MLPSEKIEPHLRAAKEFGELLDELIPLLEPAHVQQSAPTWQRVEAGNERRVELIRRGHEIAGPAAQAFLEAGMLMHYKPPPMTGMSGRTINPAQNWSTIFNEFPMFTPDELRGYTSHVEGTLQRQYDAAKDRERGPAGWLARFLLIPQSVREAAGFEDKSTGGRIAFGFGVLVQVVIGLIAGTGAAVLGAALLRVLGW